jgi:ribosomal protein S18 acetylase RimI-like enzyme
LLVVSDFWGKLSLMEINLVSSTEEISEVVELGAVIWTDHYTPIIGIDQVNYMLDKYQSVEAISKQIEEGYEYYQLCDNSELIGYMAVQKREKALFLSKIYIHRDQRGKGFGKEAMNSIFHRAKELNCDLVRLTVNKYNTNSIKTYEKIGFKNVGPAVFDIGNGYIMDDYIYEFKM